MLKAVGDIFGHRHWLTYDASCHHDVSATKDMAIVATAEHRTNDVSGVTDIHPCAVDITVIKRCNAAGTTETTAIYVTTNDRFLTILFKTNLTAADADVCVMIH